MIRGLSKIFTVFRRSDHFLVLEILNHMARAISFRVNFDKKQVEVLKVAYVTLAPGESGVPFDAVKKVLKNFGKLRGYKIILSLNPILATTVHSGVLLLRDKPRQPIDEADLDNRIAQGIWRLFDTSRSRAAAKMQVGDLDVLLTDVKVKKVRLDGHAVVNPLEFPAKTIEINFIQTFNGRNFIGQIGKLMPADQIVLMAEGGVLEAEVLAKITDEKRFLLIDLFKERSELFLSDGGTIAYLATFSWGRENLIQALSDFFAVKEGVAQEILELYLIRQASQNLLRKLEKILSVEFGRLVMRLEAPLKKYNLSLVYLFSFFGLPEFVFGQNFKNQFLSRASILPVNDEIIIDKSGFEIKNVSGKRNLFPALAALLGFYFMPQNDRINTIAKRHARWLVS